MFIDIRGFSKMSSFMQGDLVVQFLKTYHSIIAPIIRKSGGTIDKFMGDGILASFGGIKENKSHAAHALTAAHRILEHYSSWRKYERHPDFPDLDIGIGLASGEIVYGIIGDYKRYEYTVIGDVVNTAAKLEKATKTHGTPVLFDQTTHKLGLVQGCSIPMKGLSLKNVEGLESNTPLWTFETEEKEESKEEIEPDLSVL